MLRPQQCSQQLCDRTLLVLRLCYQDAGQTQILLYPGTVQQPVNGQQTRQKEKDMSHNFVVILCLPATFVAPTKAKLKSCYTQAQSNNLQITSESFVLDVSYPLCYAWLDDYYLF